jgi:hypothetical protein
MARAEPLLSAAGFLSALWINSPMRPLPVEITYRGPRTLCSEGSSEGFSSQPRKRAWKGALFLFV